MMLGAFACFHDRMPRSDSAEAVDFFSERTAAAGAAPARTAGIISTNHSLAREFSFAASVAKGKIAREMRFLRRSAPPSVRRPRRDSAEPAWCARSLRAVVPSIGTKGLSKKYSGSYVGRKADVAV